MLCVWVCSDNCFVLGVRASVQNASSAVHGTNEGTCGKANIIVDVCITVIVLRRTVRQILNYEKVYLKLEQ